LVTVSDFATSLLFFSFLPGEARADFSIFNIVIGFQ
jgi:hypothetical protein